MYDTILVATDGSDEATAALDHAIDLAATVDASLHVVTVVESTGSPLTFGVAEVDEINRAAEQLVEDVVAAHVDRDVDLHGDVRRGRPAETVLAYADEVGADLIVAGQRGADGVTGTILGSTTDRLARLTDVALTIVPSGDVDAESNDG